MRLYVCIYIIRKDYMCLIYIHILEIYCVYIYYIHHHFDKRSFGKRRRFRLLTIIHGDIVAMKSLVIDRR